MNMNVSILIHSRFLKARLLMICRKIYPETNWERVKESRFNGFVIWAIKEKIEREVVKQGVIKKKW